AHPCPPGEVLDRHAGLRSCHKIMLHESMHSWTPRLAEVSRRLRSRADAILGAVWFMPQDDLPALAARIACVGRVPGRVAAALLAPQHPGRVAAAGGDAWRDHDPAERRTAGPPRATPHPTPPHGDSPARLATRV